MRSRWPPPPFSNSVTASSLDRPSTSPRHSCHRSPRTWDSSIRPARQRDDEIAVLGQRRLAVVDEHLGPHDGIVVDLAMVGEEGADEVEVGARPDDAAGDQRLLRHRGRADHVGLPDRRIEVVDGAAVDRGGDRRRPVRGAVPDQHALDRRSYRAVGRHQVRRQSTSADHQQGAGVRAGQKAGAEPRVGGRLAVGQLGAVDERDRVGRRRRRTARTPPARTADRRPGSAGTRSPTSRRGPRRAARPAGPRNDWSLPSGPKTVRRLIGGGRR